MSAKHEDNREPQDRQPESTDSPDQPEASAEAEHSAATTGALRQERDELEQRLLRTAADFQNYVKRAEQNIESARQQQLIDMVKAMTTVLDHFDRALEVDPEQTTARDVLAGVQMVRQELLDVLARFGVERIEAEPGEAFDPNRHEAMMREQRDDIASNHITQQLQPGYLIDSKIVRPAKVGVAE